MSAAPAHEGPRPPAWHWRKRLLWTLALNRRLHYLNGYQDGQNAAWADIYEVLERRGYTKW